MARLDGVSGLHTHEVQNQPAPAGDRDLWQDDPAMRRMLPGDGAGVDGLARYGELLGRCATRDAAREANRHPPELCLFDSGGRRLDEVKFHPAYHQMMSMSVAAGYHAVAWQGGEAGHRTHAAMVYLASQVEPGHCCPLTMTYAAYPVLRAASGLPGDWADRMLSHRYDPSVQPMAAKAGVTVGMAMTEKQGGSDIRANTTRAEADGANWRLTGHKWFCSAPMSDAFLTLAQAPGGLTCFLVPRWLDQGRNAIRLQRLKDKLGNRSNASAEIEYDCALAWQLGEEGNGVRTILEMVHHTRLDTAMAPAGLMRAALREAVHWVSHRSAFQRRLVDQPLMRAVLADLVLDWQGSLALGMLVAQSFDGQDPQDRAFARIGVALAKYLSNKLCPTVVAEAMEVMGGMGYVEDTPLPLLYREAPLNGIWEGSGNIICLDVLRTLARDPLAARMLAARLDAVQGHDPALDAALAQHRARWGADVPEAEARWFAERSALLLAAAALVDSAEPAIAETFIQTRLVGDRGRLGGAISGRSAQRILAVGLPFAGE
ncbi:acyl-CoA dehydrogenase family protein [Paracoccus sp. CPCC 101403]|uniref:Acyl-CoA dehydrogenase family protein n=1 Tax=Paracoccus broussonetiae TaxID=3075834 RepID=A0ABU3ECR5_9RHOB|nr:acyl-CoA dehydrogenase family protein [Paracoccus sp. CPCC 101403]MDT1062018.1 acyl-CoA dehydrogenase family protein [Paracoccus sp. CPCC 101403]